MLCHYENKIKEDGLFTDATFAPKCAQVAFVSQCEAVCERVDR